MFPNSFASPQVQPEGTKRILLAEVRPNRPSLFIDLLNVFSATYDTYDIVAEGLYPTVADRLNLQFAVAGVVDTAANYFYRTDSFSNAVSGNVSYISNSNTGITGKGCQFLGQFTNVNSLTGNKKFLAQVTTETDVAAMTVGQCALLYTPASAITGFRLKWESANTFQAKGSVLVYGITRY